MGARRNSETRGHIDNACARAGFQQRQKLRYQPDRCGQIGIEARIAVIGIRGAVAIVLRNAHSGVVDEDIKRSITPSLNQRIHALPEVDQLVQEMEGAGLTVVDRERMIPGDSVWGIAARRA